MKKHYTRKFGFDEKQRLVEIQQTKICPKCKKAKMRKVIGPYRKVLYCDACSNYEEIKQEEVKP